MIAPMPQEQTLTRRSALLLVRNRLIAALTRGTVVVEAAARSGARPSARRAQKLGLQVMIVLSPVTSAMSVGCHELLATSKLGVVLVADAARVGRSSASRYTSPTPS